MILPRRMMPLIVIGSSSRCVPYVTYSNSRLFLYIESVESVFPTGFPDQVGE
jgi:hypothetical protein